MKKTPPRTEFTIKEWFEDMQYPTDAFVSYKIPTDNPRVFKNGRDKYSFEVEEDGWHLFKPKKMYDDPHWQREYLIKEIRKLYTRDKAKHLMKISFDGSRLSEYDMSRLWPDWHVTALGEWWEIKYKKTGIKKTIFVAYERGAKLPGIKPSQIFHEGAGNWRKKFRAPIEAFFISCYHGYATEARNMMNKDGTWKGLD